MALTHPAYGQLRQVTPTAAVLLCNNPGVMTLDGTNTWILRAEGADECIVVDPGPRDKKHLAKVAGVGRVALTLVTHRHSDHTAGLKRFAKKTGAPVRSRDTAFTDELLSDGEVIEAAGISLSVLATPGHTKDSVSFLVGDDAVLTGDTILGRGTTVLDPKDGTLKDYLASLDRLIEVGRGRKLLPGHGPDLDDASAVGTYYRDHRLERLDQIRAALDVLGPDAKPMKVVRHVYKDVDKKLWPAARMSVKAQLTYLRES